MVVSIGILFLCCAICLVSGFVAGSSLMFWYAMSKSTSWPLTPQKFYKEISRNPNWTKRLHPDHKDGYWEIYLQERINTNWWEVRWSIPKPAMPSMGIEEDKYIVVERSKQFWNSATQKEARLWALRKADELNQEGKTPGDYDHFW